MADPDRDLLFALMAVRSNLITSEELLAAVAGIAPGESGSLVDYLIGRGVLRGEEVATVVSSSSWKDAQEVRVS